MVRCSAILLFLTVSSLVLGCDSEPDPADDDSVGDDDTAADDDVADDDTGADDDTAADDDVSDDDTTAVDCDGLPPGPLPFETLTGLYASEDFAFDDQGHLISHHGNGLFRQEYPPGDVEMFAVTAGGSGGPASMRMLATGDLVYANVDTSSLYRVDPAGNTEVVYGALAYAMGIDIHIDGQVFLSDLMGVLRIDPYSGAMEIVVESGALNYANGITFSEDYGALYFGTHDGVFAVAVDGDGTPTGTPQLWAESPDGELLGMGVDRCGNVYVLHDGRRLLRYPPEGGEPETLVELPEWGWMTNLQWGSGVGGWDDQAIYITDRNATAPAYYEVPVGVRSKVY
jgi:hypothetical protein